MPNKLSIIIPCYNSQKTLREAVVSIYTQQLAVPFEVMIVDDGSKDDTRGLIVNLANEYKEIKYIFHEKNRGGGAARNTGIKNTNGNLIFCLDSDNFFAPNVLQKMIDYLDKKQCDGVAINERRFFLGNNKRKYQSHFNSTVDGKIVIDNLFDESGVLPDNFLLTRDSYNLTGEYPENHGFDTQSFETRYLAMGNHLIICPDSIFYHRQDPDRNSYFQRVYKSGEFSKNTYLVYEDIIFLFSREVRKKIMEYDIFKNSKFGDNDLKLFVSNLYLENKEKFYIEDKEKYLHPDGFQLFYNDFKSSDIIEDVFACSVFLFKNRDYLKSLDCIKWLLNKELDSPVLYFNLLRNSIIMFGKTEPEEIESKVISVAYSLIPFKQKISSVPPLIISWLNNFPVLKKFIKKFF